MKTFRILCLLSLIASPSAFAFDAFVGDFALATTTGNQSVSGVGFQPNVVMFFSSLMTAEGRGASAFQHIGAAKSSSARWSFGAYSEHSDGLQDGDYSFDTDECIALYWNGSYLIEADFVSMDSDGFTINIGTTNGTAYRVAYVAMNATSVDVGTFDSPTDAATDTEVNVTGSFEPDLVFSAATLGTTEGGGTSGYLSFGFAGSPSSEAGISHYNQDNPVNSVEKQLQSESAFALAITSSLYNSGNLKSMDSDGFTVDWTTVGGAAVRYGYVAIAGVNTYISSYTTASGTGDDAETGVGFQGELAFFTNIFTATEDSITNNYNHAIGAASSSTGEFVTNINGRDGHGGGSTTQRYYHNTDIMSACQWWSPYTCNMLGNFKSFDSDGFTIDMTTVTWTVHTHYLVVGDSSAVANAELVASGMTFSGMTLSGTNT